MADYNLILEKTSESAGSSPASVSFFHSDRQFNVRGLTNLSGNIVELYSYTPYGKQTILTASGTEINESAYNNCYGFTGRYLDEETGLWYFRARYFDNELGRFISRDPLGFVDGSSLYNGYFAERFALDPSGKLWWILPLIPLLGGCEEKKDYEYKGNDNRNCHQVTFNTDDKELGYNANPIQIKEMWEEMLKRLKDNNYIEVPCKVNGKTNPQGEIIFWLMENANPPPKYIPLHSARKEEKGWMHVGINGKESDIYWTVDMYGDTTNSGLGSPNKDFKFPNTGKLIHKCFGKAK